MGDHRSGELNLNSGKSVGLPVKGGVVNRLDKTDASIAAVNEVAPSGFPHEIHRCFSADYRFATEPTYAHAAFAMLLSARASGVGWQEVREHAERHLKKHGVSAERIGAEVEAMRAAMQLWLGP